MRSPKDLFDRIKLATPGNTVTITPNEARVLQALSFGLPGEVEIRAALESGGEFMFYDGRLLIVDPPEEP